MPKLPKRNPLAKLPQQDEHWHVFVHLMRTWMPNEDGDMIRPPVLMLVNITHDFILKSQICPEHPKTEDIRDLLFEAMVMSEPSMNHKMHRPTLITIEEAEFEGGLIKPLADLNIDLQLVERPEEINKVVQHVNSMPGLGPEIPGLLSVEGTTPELIGDLFAAAAGFYRANPWYHLKDQHPLKIELVSVGAKAGGPLFYGVVMGSAGMQYGLAVYETFEDIRRLFGFADSPQDAIPPSGGRSISYDELIHVPFDDLDAIEEYGWEIAAEQAYPAPYIFMPSKEVLRPTLEEIYWYIAALRAIPFFIDEHLTVGESGDYEPADTIMKVGVNGEIALIHITYPSGELPPQEEWPSAVDSWPDEDEDDGEFIMPDRRGMEGFMADLFGPGEDTPENRAQEIMYRAWEEQNPARRIVLAHEALEVSPNCADAYVLLAEEEADTIGRTVDYYELGVAAGERALGPELFEEAVGHFWGMLETRPYMRAREGLATSLWRVGRLDEAKEHMHELLRLNPSDNQGIRYLLLELLVQMEAYDKAQALLDAYEDDALAYWLYTQVLLAFRAHGDSEIALDALEEAWTFNAHVPPYLLGEKKIPGHLPAQISIGQESEAQSYASSYLAHWRKTPGALEWLQEHTKQK